VRGHQGIDTDDWRGLINTRVDRQARWQSRQRVMELENALQAEAAE